MILQKYRSTEKLLFTDFLYVLTLCCCGKQGIGLFKETVKLTGIVEGPDETDGQDHFVETVSPVLWLSPEVLS